MMAGTMSVWAQKKTEYFPNGNKKFEGNYRWAWNSFDGRDHLNFESTDRKKAYALKAAEQNNRVNALPAKLYDGKCTFYYENGNLSSTGNYDNGVKNGLFTYYYSDGSKQAECGYKQGMPDGEWKKWMPNGKPASVTNYKRLSDAELDTTWTHRVYENFQYSPFKVRYARPTAEPDSLRGLLRYWTLPRREAEAMLNQFSHWHGDQIVYYDNGVPGVEMHFDNDVPTGIWHYRDTSGKVVVEVVYTNGVITGGFNELKQEVGRRPNQGYMEAAMASGEGMEPGTATAHDGVVEAPVPRDAKQNNATGIDPGSGQAAAATSAPVFTYVEQMPVPGFDLTEYLSNNIRYPDAAARNNIQGRVVAKFVVNENGTLSDVQIVRGIGAGCDDEATRVIKAMPAWKPGKQNGKPVKVYYTLPITFSLSK